MHTNTQPPSPRSTQRDACFEGLNNCPLGPKGRLFRKTQQLSIINYQLSIKHKQKLLLLLMLFLPLFTATAQTGLDQTAAQIAAKMGVGWNLGNTLEAGNNANNYTNRGGLGAETYWQSTKTTPQLIEYIKSLGFRSIRIPCAWVMGHISNPDDHTIDPQWMERVRQIVDYCTSAGLYVLLNDHWDGGWLEEHIKDTDPNTIAQNKATLRDLWTQIATQFRDYDEHLLFAGLNEPNADTQAATDNLIAYEQVFIDAVRATGGNNLKRVLVVQGPSTNIDHTCNYFDITKLTDPTPNRLCVEIHFYYPWQFWGMTKDESWGNQFYYWGSGNHVSGSRHNATWGEESDMRREAQKMKTHFVDKGYPVINGEYGVMWRVVSGAGESQQQHDASIRAYYKYMNELCLEMGIVPFAWDTNWCPAHTRSTDTPMTIVDRQQLSVYNPLMMDAIDDVLRTTAVSLPAPPRAVAPAGATYDLSGRRHTSSHAPHGLYIVDGKKGVK